MRADPDLAYVSLSDTRHKHILICIDTVDTWCDPCVTRERGSNVYVQRVAPRMDASPTDDYSHLPYARAAEAFGGLETGHIVAARQPVHAASHLLLSVFRSIHFIVLRRCLHSCLGVVGPALSPFT